MEKRNPLQKRDHTLKVCFARWVFFNRLGCTSQPTVDAMHVNKVPISV